jgi:hypothetical protein
MMYCRLRRFDKVQPLVGDAAGLFFLQKIASVIFWHRFSSTGNQQFDLVIFTGPRRARISTRRHRRHQLDHFFVQALVVPYGQNRPFLRDLQVCKCLRDTRTKSLDFLFALFLGCFQSHSRCLANSRVQIKLVTLFFLCRFSDDWRNTHLCTEKSRWRQSLELKNV